MQRRDHGVCERQPRNGGGGAAGHQRDPRRARTLSRSTDPLFSTLRFPRSAALFGKGEKKRNPAATKSVQTDEVGMADRNVTGSANGTLGCCDERRGDRSGEDLDSER